MKVQNSVPALSLNSLIRNEIVSHWLSFVNILVAFLQLRNQGPQSFKPIKN